ncbi:MAG: amino acid ABC transporter substrate-binding protein [Streptosporangiaceae bacterium]|jgi:branched-chain amino acid transport system substrate-binding protein
MGAWFPTRVFPLVFSAALVAATVVGCSGSGSGNATSKSPIVIGAALSLSGDDSADGIAYERGYTLWANDVNKAGGLLGRQVKLDILNDNSDPTQVVTDYQKLININHADLLFGPFSSLLTKPAAGVANRYGYAFVEGAGGAPSVFQLGYHDLFDVSLPVIGDLVPLINWVKSLPASQRPKSISYVTSTDPFTQPQVTQAQQDLSAAGIPTAYNKSFPAEVTDYLPIADQVAGAKADAVILGSVDVPTVSAFIHAFAQQHYEPKFFIATSGPDQGAAFVQAVGASDTNGVMVPNPWYPGEDIPASQKVVNEYVTKYGGPADQVNSDVAEAYSVGMVMAQAVTAVKSLNQTAIINYLHSGVTLTSAQGPVQFNSLGENLKPAAYVFQWQNGKFVQVLPVGASGSVSIQYPKANWGS